MDRTAQEFLKKLTETHSPSGFEVSIQKVIRERIKESVDDVRIDVNGNLISAINPDAPLRVMLDGHCDEIGLMITHIDDKGFLYFQAIGGVDPSVIVGARVDIHAAGGVVAGVIGKKAIHMMEREEVGKAGKLKDLWIDIGAKDKKDAQKAVAVGDSITIARRFTELRNGLFTARGLDNRVGAFVIAETMRRLKRAKPRCAVYGVTSVQEELGLRGAQTSCFGIDPHVGIAVDVGFSSDCPDTEKKLVGDVSLGKGPILFLGAYFAPNPALSKLIQKVAKEKKIPLQLQAEAPFGRTDANVIQTNRAGVAAALVSIPNRYMHTPAEVCSLKDLDLAVDLLVAVVAAIKPGMDFTPR